MGKRKIDGLLPLSILVLIAHLLSLELSVNSAIDLLLSSGLFIHKVFEEASVKPLPILFPLG